MEWGGRWEEGSRGRRHHVYLWLIHVDVWQKPTEFCKAIILQLKKKILECVDMSFSRESSPPRDITCLLSLLHLATMEASLVARMVKNLPTVQETQVRSLGEDPLK